MFVCKRGPFRARRTSEETPLRQFQQHRRSQQKGCRLSYVACQTMSPKRWSKTKVACRKRTCNFYGFARVWPQRTDDEHCSSVCCEIFDAVFVNAVNFYFFTDVISNRTISSLTHRGLLNLPFHGDGQLVLIFRSATKANYITHPISRECVAFFAMPQPRADDQTALCRTLLKSAGSLRALCVWRGTSECGERVGWLARTLQRQVHVWSKVQRRRLQVL